jgi:hypothetical protein
MRLERLAIGGVELGSLPVGEHRWMSEEELVHGLGYVRWHEPTTADGGGRQRRRRGARRTPPPHRRRQDDAREGDALMSGRPGSARGSGGGARRRPDIALERPKPT